MSQHTPSEKSSKFQKRTQRFIRKEIAIGILISIISTASGIYLYLQYFSKYGFDETVKMIQEGDLYSSVLALAALPNLFVFFVFIKKKQDYRARGVLMASILTALITFVLKFT